jgi:hypothetical protein
MIHHCRRGAIRCIHMSYRRSCCSFVSQTYFYIVSNLNDIHAFIPNSNKLIHYDKISLFLHQNVVGDPSRSTNGFAALVRHISYLLSRNLSSHFTPSTHPPHSSFLLHTSQNLRIRALSSPISACVSLRVFRPATDHPRTPDTRPMLQKH